MKVFLDDGAKLPSRAHYDDAGLDLFCRENVTVPAYGCAVVDTGVHVEIPAGYVGLLTSKSGLMRHNGITCRGTIDAGYTGSIQAVLFNHSETEVNFKAGQKVTQLVIMPIMRCYVHQVESLEEFESSERGDSGFGSTGK